MPGLGPVRVADHAARSRMPDQLRSRRGPSFRARSARQGKVRQGPQRRGYRPAGRARVPRGDRDSRRETTTIRTASPSSWAATSASRYPAEQLLARLGLLVGAHGATDRLRGHRSVPSCPAAVRNSSVSGPAVTPSTKQAATRRAVRLRPSPAPRSRATIGAAAPSSIRAELRARAAKATAISSNAIPSAQASRASASAGRWTVRWRTSRTAAAEQDQHADREGPTDQAGTGDDAGDVSDRGGIMGSLQLTAGEEQHGLAGPCARTCSNSAAIASCVPARRRSRSGPCFPSRNRPASV